MKTLTQFILEKQGIFNGCEDISNELIKLIINETKKGIEEDVNIRIVFDASKYNPIFRDDIIVNIKYNFLTDDKIIANTALDDEQLFKYDTGRLALSQKDIDILESKPYCINIEADIEEIDLYDLKGMIMHELTHFYTALLFFNKNENYFSRKYYSPNNFKNDSEYLLYFVQKDEVNSWVTEMKPEIDKIKTKGFDNVLNNLKESTKFKKIIDYRNVFNEDNKLFDFEKNNLKDYPELYRKHFNTEDNDHKIYLKTKDKINKAYNQLFKTVVKNIYEYRGSNDFIKENNFDNPFEPWRYLSRYNNKRVSHK